MIRRLEPFAYGYFHSKAESKERRIADGIYETAKSLPLTIDPEIGLAGIDRSPVGAIEDMGAALNILKKMIIQLN